MYGSREGGLLMPILASLLATSLHDIIGCVHFFFGG